MTFQIHALPAERFASYFDMRDDELAGRRALRQTVTAKPGFPCRVSLADAEIGEQVILAHFEHHQAATPFRASHAVYVREGVTSARPAPGDVPDVFRTRTISLRAFDARGMMIDADLVDGNALEQALESAFEDDTVAYIHLHFAAPGCFAALATRA